MNNTESIKATASTPSRRTIVKGAAWAVPAIAVAGAVPAFAASPCIDVGLTADSCKCPGQSTNDPWAYDLGLVITNNCGTTLENLLITRVTNNANKALYETPALTPGEELTYGPFTLAPGATVTTATIKGYTTSSAGKLRVYYSINGVPQDGYIEIPAPPDCTTCAE